MKRWKGAALLLLCTVVLLRLLQGLAQPEKENAHVPVLGIVTTAAEDDRREAQSEALVHAAEEHGFKVLEMPVERTQEAQIEAVRALIVYQVDAIAFTPLVESGWDNVLREAKSASVPLLSIDRAIRGVDDVPLQHIGFDYASLAEQAADALLQQRMPRDGVLELYGTVNASDAREIARGCRASLEEHGLTVTYSLCGDGMRAWVVSTPQSARTGCGSAPALIVLVGVMVWLTIRASDNLEGAIGASLRRLERLPTAAPVS